MRLPDALQQRPFAEWNRLVKGIVEVWELARSLGFEETLEEHLSHDEEGRLAALLGCLGCELLDLKASDALTDKSSPYEALMNEFRLFVANVLMTFFYVSHNGLPPDRTTLRDTQLASWHSVCRARVVPLRYTNNAEIPSVGAFALHGDQSAGDSCLIRTSARARSRA